MSNVLTASQSQNSLYASGSWDIIENSQGIPVNTNPPDGLWAYLTDGLANSAINLQGFMETLTSPNGYANFKVQDLPGNIADAWGKVLGCFPDNTAAVAADMQKYMNFYELRKKIAIKSENDFKAQNPELIEALHRTSGKSVNSYDSLIKTLERYYSPNGEANLAEFRKIVTAGENIAKALFSSKGPGLPQIEFEGKSLEICCNSYTTLALSWYMMVAAASQDALREKNGDKTASDMLDSGSLIMRDPDNRIYNFLKSNTEVYARTSTHFAERLAHDNKYVALGIETGPSQNGIEDYTRNMPCNGGTILFDKLKPGSHGEAELFVKFESTGVPPMTSKDSNASYAGIFLNMLAATGHSFEHTFSFIATRFSNSSAQNVRQEHLYKGRLQHIYESIKALFKHELEFTALSKEMKTHGLPAAIKAIDKLIQKATDEGRTETVNQANAVLAILKTELEDLGKISDRYGIERRGAEVHITLDPNEVSKILEEACALPTDEDVRSVQDIPSHDDPSELLSADLGHYKPEDSKLEEELDTSARPSDAEIPMVVSEEFTSANSKPSFIQAHDAEDDVVIADAHLTNTDNRNGFDNTESSLAISSTQKRHDNALSEIESPSTQTNTGDINSTDQGDDGISVSDEKHNDKSEATTQPPPKSGFGRFTSWLSGWATYLTAWIKHFIRW